MGKFRSKLKRRAKAKHWAYGQSATTNPENKKHRNQARSRFFQPNLSLAPSTTATTNGATPLTLEAITKHDTRLSYAGTGKTPFASEPTINDIAVSMRSINVNDDGGESEGKTYAKTFQSFASQYSVCSNMTFNKFLNRFQQSSDLHKEMLAILSAITEVIKERNGTESSTEYFLGLMEALEAAKEENEIIACLSLLTMVVKTVPKPVLRKKFTDVGPILMQLLEQFAESENQNVLRSIIGSISVLLRAQEYSSWSAGLTLKLFNQVLSFVIHTKPNIRKAAQHAIESIIHGCCFMVSQQLITDDDTDIEAIKDNPKILFHPAGVFVTKFCVEQFKAENITKSQTIVLHTIELLKKTLSGLKTDDIKDICEHLLSIMITSKMTTQKNCFDTLDHLFASKSSNLSPDLVGKLIAAIYDYRPERSDVNLTLAWLNVMKQGHVCLATFNVTKCLMELPRFMVICAGDIWKSDNIQIATGAYHTIKQILEECVKPGCETEALVNLHRKPITRVLNEIAKCLAEPFGHVAQQIVGVFQAVFEVCGRHYPDLLQPALNQIAARYDDNAPNQLKIENAVRAAISTMGPEAALKAVPLTDASGCVNIQHLWILQSLKKATTGSSFEYFYLHILPLANQCYDNWKRHQIEENLALARTNELFYVQLWDLFPSFCENPRDMNKFGSIAKILGEALKHKIEIRGAIFNGLKKLLQNADHESKQQLARFARNFLNILLNIYTKKPTGSEEHTTRIDAMQVIGEYLNVSPNDVLVEIFEAIKTEYKAKERVETVMQKVQELNASIERDEEDDDNVIDALEAKRIQDAYDSLKNLLQENGLGIEYVDGNADEVAELLEIVPRKRLQQLFKSTQQFVGTFAYQAYFDLLVCLAVYQSSAQLKELFDEYIAPTLRNAKKGGVTRLIKERQAKSYDLLKNILQSGNKGCQQFVTANLMDIQKVLLNTLQNRKNTSQEVRLTCLLLLIEKEEAKLQYNSKLISRTIPEIVLAFNLHATKKTTENISLRLLIKIGEIYQKVDKINDFAELLMAGLDADADDVLVANTIQVLQSLLQHFTDNLTLTTMNSILEQIVGHVVSASRQRVKASIAFLMVFVKILPASYVANHLSTIVRAMSAMKPDTKRFYRKQLGFMYKRLCKRFTPEEIVKLVPGNDEITHKKLKNIRKELARSKRQRAENEKKDDSDEDDVDGGVENNSDEDILADSDSDSELEEDILMDADENNTERYKKKPNRNKEQKFIYEDADTIVDLADIKAMSSIASSKPFKQSGEIVPQKKKQKDPNRGFQLSVDGRLIIEEPKRGGHKVDDSDSDDEDGNNDDNLVGDKTTIDDDNSDSDNEAAEIAKTKSRKRKASGSLSMASGKTATGSKYVAGGKGIHRPLNGAASIRSGLSRMSGRTGASNKAPSTAYGTDYRSKKAKGDVKKKGGVDPYAYIPLSRNTLNKRKRAKSSGQFKSIVTGSRKGTAAGSKNKKRKAN